MRPESRLGLPGSTTPAFRSLYIRTLTCLAFLAACFASTFSGRAAAAPADLDATFGTGGVAVHSVVTGSDELRAMAIQPDGKIVAVGRSIVSSSREFAIMRINTDGSLDTTFSGDGLLTLDVVGGRHDDVYDVAIQPDGKIVASGCVEYGPSDGTLFATVRLNQDGSYDNTFDSDGRVFTNFGVASDDHQAIKAIAIQTDGKIVVGGHTDVSGNKDFALARYNTNGSLDTTFSGDGKLTHWIGAQEDLIEDLAIQPDGKIVAAGSSAGIFTDFDFVVARYNSNGVLDPTFNDTGVRVTPSMSDADYGKGVAIQSDGRIVLAGYSRNGSDGSATVLRYTADGQKDSAFGTAGMATAPLPPAATSAEEVALQNNDKIVIAGQYYTNSPAVQDFFVAQFDWSGKLDSTFDGDGMLTKAVSPNADLAQAVAVQPDGKIVAAGWADDGVDYAFGFMRLSGELPYEPLPARMPVAKIKSPSKSKVAAKSLRALSGTAGPPGEVAKVEVALRRVDRRALKAGRCLWLKNAKGSFTKVKASRRKCTKRRFLRASGSERWSYRLKNQLPKGSYELFVRVTLKTGEANTTFTKAAGNLRVFRVV